MKPFACAARPLYFFLRINKIWDTFDILGKDALRVNALIEARPYRPEDIRNLSPAEFLSEIIHRGKLIYDEAA